MGRRKVEQVEKPAKAKEWYRVTNWAEYNRALINRGSLTIWLDEEVLAAWRPAERPNRMGRTPVYSDLAITVILTLQAVYNLALRQTQGLMESLVEVLEVDLPVPNYTTLSRRMPHLQVELPR